MSVDIGYGLRKPQDGDKNFWDNIEDLFDAFVAHSHDGQNSEVIDSSGIVKPSQVIAANDWVAVPHKGYQQTIAAPVGVSLDKQQPVFYVNSGPETYKRVHPTVNYTSLTTMEVMVNDSSLELKVIYL